MAKVNLGLFIAFNPIRKPWILATGKMKDKIANNDARPIAECLLINF